MNELSKLNWNRTNLDNIEEAWKGDLWDRKRLGVQLTNYVDRLQCGAVLALDARWGEGKTWFVKHWKKHLEDEKHSVIYLDAFANDYLDDPFLTIASEISHAFKESDEINNQDIDDFNSKTASVLISLAAILPVIAAKAGLYWIGLGGAGEAVQELYKNGEELYDSVSDEITAKVKEHIEKKIENHQIEKESIRDFKNELAQLAKKLDKPLVFIIDELDRCRPDFAIRLIERIKHFFDIPKIVFILVMNKPQLIQSVHSLYGYAVETNGDYFEKFIDFTITFPQLNAIRNYEMLLKEQLFRIGEIGDQDHVSGFYFWILALQLYKNYNSRELIRKINQFALLKSNNLNKDMILIAIIFDNDFQVIVKYFRRILKTLLENILGDIINRNNEDYIARNLMSSLKEKYGVSSLGVLELADQLENFAKQYTTSGQMDEKESALLDLYSDYSVTKLCKSDDLVTTWKNYIESGFISETQPKS
ncbi:P-loop NTPase fold protein [Acinetobacter beijerinckii]|uniref:KAP family P-loop NTPase fold protein n=1 Tax=Acinetobacter beijerinckii TaxID=262668 RepID=UPI0024060395|nr:P-loop NTPase fold protein [Acinetobacter beijerinckii]